MKTNTYYIQIYTTVKRKGDTGNKKTLRTLNNISLQICTVRNIALI